MNNECYQIITNYDENKILLKKTDGKFYLPTHRLDLAEEIFSELKKETGLDTTLYFLDFKFLDKDKNEISLNLSIAEEFQPKNSYYWININDLDHDLDHNFSHLNLVKKWINEIRLKDFFVPWFNKNWFSEIKPYIKNILERNGYSVLGEIKQFYLSKISCILKVETNQGFIYIKRVLPPLFEKEPLITKKMSEYEPKYFPEIVFIDSKKGLIFTKDFGENVLAESKNIDDFLNTVKSYAKLQIAMIKHSANLISVGMVDRSLNKMLTQLKDMLIKGDKIFLDEENCLTSQEVKQILENFEKIEGLVLELSKYNIPETIDHGDLHNYNISIKDGNIIFYDWADCSISHPFISMRVFFWSVFGQIENPIEYFNTKDDPYELLLSAYLEDWKEYGAVEDLRKAFDLSQKISYISFSIQYILLVDSLENHSKLRYKDYIYGGLKNLIYFLDGLNS